MNKKPMTIIPVIDRSRKDDFTVEELQQMECFQQYSPEQLTMLLNTMKSYTRSILHLHKKEQVQRKKSVKLTPSINESKRAA